MKTILLIRHAKSSWEHDVTDVERPLKTRGYSDANLLSKEFLKYDFVPDAIYSSPANRALTTCKIFMENCNYPSTLLQIKEQLYDFGGSQVTDFVKVLDDQLDKVIIFGHNNAFTNLANRFGDIAIDNVPTCGLVMLHFDIDYWQNIDKGTTKLTLFPRHLK